MWYTATKRRKERRQSARNAVHMKDKAKRRILLGSFALVLAALAAMLPLLFPHALPKLSASEPRTVLTPEPKTEEDAVKMRTPVPTLPPQATATPRPVYPEKAVNVLVNGVPVFAVDSREVAEQLVRFYLDECANENLDVGDVLLTATIDAELSTVPADGEAEYLAFDAALMKLRRNRSLIPVRRTVEHVSVLSDPPERLNENSPLLPVGSRMFRRYGVGARTLVFSETLYKDGLAVSETETLRMPVQAGVARSVLTGTYRLSPYVTPDEDGFILTEGQRGRTSASLSFVTPIRGKLVGCFGLASGRMRYGVDYSAAPGTRIVAPESGTVVFLGERPGYGYLIEIRHEDGFVSRISCGANANVYELVLERHVNRGETIALLPEIEGEPESVLHYELLIDGIPYNPLYYLPESKP